MSNWRSSVRLSIDRTTGSSSAMSSVGWAGEIGSKPSIEDSMPPSSTRRSSNLSATERWAGLCRRVTLAAVRTAGAHSAPQRLEQLARRRRRGRAQFAQPPLAAAVGGDDAVLVARRVGDAHLQPVRRLAERILAQDRIDQPRRVGVAPGGEAQLGGVLAGVGDQARQAVAALLDPDLAQPLQVVAAVGTAIARRVASMRSSPCSRA